MPTRHQRSGRCLHVEVEFVAASLLGEHNKKSRVRFRHTQIEHSRRVSVRNRFDIHGLVLSESFGRVKQGVTVGQTSILQRSAQVPQMGRVVLC